jgi:glc operon protein GlcG
MFFFLSVNKMVYKPYLTVADAIHVLNNCKDEAKKNAWKIAVAVCDDGGHLMVFERGDDVPQISSGIAINKARTAAMGRRNSGIYEDQINSGRGALVTAPEVKALMKGGVPITFQGFCIGAVGISNLKPNEDENVAVAGIAKFLSDKEN